MKLQLSYCLVRCGAVRIICLGLLAAPLSVRSLSAQVQTNSITRSQAISLALKNAPGLRVALADSVAALAQLLTARALPNPALSAEYTKSSPQYHFRIEQPIDFPGLRGLRIRSAKSAQLAVSLRLAYAKALAALDADTTYTRALAARARAHLSVRNSLDADSLLGIAVARRNAGDASDLDVELATVFAGQAAAAAAADSLAYLSVLLDLQAAIGTPEPEIPVYPGDSLDLPPPAAELTAPAATGPVLAVKAAEHMLQSAKFALSAERRGVFSGISIAAGFETHDPAGAEKGLLPAVGIVFPIPLFNRNKGPIAQARADEMRATAELRLMRLESHLAIARAERELSTAMRRLALDKSVVAAATRVSMMSLTAYREGATSLAASLEGQRSAREARMQYIDDLASAWIASARLRVLRMTQTEIPANK